MKPSEPLVKRCQTNLGFASPGGLSLSVCGDDLTTADSSATLMVTNGTPQSVVVMPVGLVNAPTPFKGGTLVPVPWLLLVPLTTGPSGSAELVVPGSAGVPATLYMQVIDPNGLEFRFSNAIEVVIGV